MATKKVPPESAKKEGPTAKDYETLLEAIETAKMRAEKINSPRINNEIDQLIRLVEQELKDIIYLNYRKEK